MRSKIQKETNQLVKTVDCSYIFKLNQIPFPPIINRYAYGYNKKEIQEFSNNSERFRKIDSIMQQKKKRKKYSISNIMKSQSRQPKQKLNILAENIRQKFNNMISKSINQQKQWIRQQFISPRRLIKKYKLKNFQEQNSLVIVQKKTLQNLTLAQYEKQLLIQTKKKERQIQAKVKQRKKEIQDNKKIQFTRNIIEKRKKMRNLEKQALQIQKFDKIKPQSTFKIQKNTQNIQRIVSQKKRPQLTAINKIINETKDIRPWTNHINLED